MCAFAIVKEELGTLIQTSTPTTKAIAYVLVVSYLVNLVLPFSATYLALVPEKTIPCVWNVFTSGTRDRTSSASRWTRSG